MKRTRKKTTKQETLQQPTVAITMTAEDKAAAEKVAALREAEAAQKAREDAMSMYQYKVSPKAHLIYKVFCL